GVLSPERELMMFRIAQEALSNIVKHAHATKVIIIISYLPAAFRMEISDDGTGFDQNSDKASGIGLINMRQRVEVMNGVLQILSTPGSGTTLTINIPYE
ncbi:MAG TPA: ATP-binding protein, partial [Chitinophagaceae bacterium]|nr:ATP-binding protein [Chitinophagaceae bacterium]